MKMALLSKAALCVCPPAMMAATVAAVPEVRSAVHRATAPTHRTQAQHRTLAYTPSRDRMAPGKPIDEAGTGAQPCPPGLIRTAAPFEPLPPVLNVTTPDIGTGPTTGDVPTPTRPPVIDGVPDITPGIFGGAVPEPATWLSMIAGFGLIGAMLRSRHHAPLPAGRGRESRYGRYRRSRLGTGAKLLALGDLIVAPVSSTVHAGTQSLKTGLLAKAAMCVCPPAVIAMTAVAVPPVRSAVYQATATPGAVAAPRAAEQQADVPCLPVANSSAIVASVAAPELPASMDASKAVPATLASALGSSPAEPTLIASR